MFLAEIFFKVDTYRSRELLRVHPQIYPKGVYVTLLKKFEMKEKAK